MAEPELSTHFVWESGLIPRDLAHCPRPLPHLGQWPRSLGINLTDSNPNLVVNSYDIQSNQISPRPNYFPKRPRWTRNMGWQMGYEVQCLKLSNQGNHRSTQPFERFYTLNKKVLAQLDKVKHLGFMIREDLNWNPNINSMVTKADKYVDFIKRNINNCPQDIR